EIANKMRSFHGAGNMDQYLARILDTFPDAKRVVVSGESAGGFGAAFNYDRVARAFGSKVDVRLLDDSGPPMAVAYVPACLQKVFLDTWGLDKTLPPGCSDCAQADGVFMEPFLTYVAKTYDKRRAALISSTEDKVISQFWGYGDDDCANVGGAG